MTTKTCSACGQSLPDESRFCTRCGARIEEPRRPVTLPREEPAPPPPGGLNLAALYVMAALLLLALVFPPWETPPAQPPEFLGLHFLLSPPRPDAKISLMLLTVELFTIAVAGVYGAWAFRKR